MDRDGRGFWAGELDGLVGRDETLRTLRELLDSGCRTAVITGIAGAGKTSVLTVVSRAAMAEGRRVLALTCHESDRDLPFGMLVDLLSTAPGAEAVLDLVVARTDRPAAVDPLRLRLDVLSWLERASEERPVLVVVDDAQWSDESSLSVLGFVAHRVVGSNASVLVAARGETAPTTLRGHPGIALPPLADAQASALLRRAGIAPDALTLPSVLDRAAGNPLALLELGRAASTGGGEGRVPSSVDAAFREQLEGMPCATRWVLLLAAAGDGDLGVLGRVVEPGELLRALTPAEQAGLVTVTGRVVRFRHPLLRAAAHAQRAADRLRAHACLAAAYAGDPEREAWHRAEASVVPDEEVAAALAAASELALRRGASVEATRLMARAAELSIDRPPRESRMLRAVEVASVSGAFEWAARAGARLRAGSEDRAIQLRAARVAAYTLAQTERSNAARRALIEVLEQAKDVDPFWGWSSLTTLAALSYRRGTGAREVGEWLDAYEHAMEGADNPFPAIVAAARAWIRLQIDPASTPDGALELVRDAPVPLDYPPDVVGTHEMLLGAAAWLLDEPVIAIERLSRSLEIKRRDDQPGEMTQTLIALALVQFAVGDYDAADEAGRLVQDIAEARNQSYALVDGWDLRARVAAVRGDVDRARRLLDQVILELPLEDSLALEVTVRVTSSWVRLAEQDTQGAWNDVRWIFLDDGEPRHPHICYRELGTYAHLAMRVGATEELEQVLAVAARRLPRPRPYHRMQLARARALGAGEDAEPWHVEAVNAPDAMRWPFEHANAQLEYGAWLRRRHRRTQARAHLQAALDVFTRLGTRPWMELARAELRAAGGATAVAESAAWADLTGQERQVVLMAASGMTNPEIAAALYLSPRTVSTHLYNAFPKLGVTSRTQLRDVVPS